MKDERLLIVGVFSFLIGCGSTYQRETIKEHVKELAKREYQLDVKVKEVGETLGVQFEVDNMLGELTASDQRLWKQMDNLMQVLSRIGLSTDNPPEFLVLDIVDRENPNIHFLFTQFVQDVKKVMSEGLSRSQYLDRFVMELVVGKRRIDFDPKDMDLVRLMMLAVDTDEPTSKFVEFDLEEVDYPVFLGQVISNTLRRLCREKRKVNDFYELRDVKTSYEEDARGEWGYRTEMDLVPLEVHKQKKNYLEEMILPFAKEEALRVLKSYKFTAFSNLTIVEKNSGATIAGSI